MRHLKTLGRATNLSSSKLHHIERQTGREWRIHPHMHRNTPHADFGPAQTPPWTPLRTQNVLTTYGTSESARISCPSKCSISSAAPVLSGVLMHTPVGTLRTHALAMPEACREPFAVICGPRNGTSHSARNSCLSDQSPAHENASRQAVYGPGVAAQVNSFLTRALGIPKRTLGSLCTRKKRKDACNTRHHRQRA